MTTRIIKWKFYEQIMSRKLSQTIQIGKFELFSSNRELRKYLAEICMYVYTYTQSASYKILNRKITRPKFQSTIAIYAVYFSIVFTLCILHFTMKRIPTF